ncbi:ribonuclease H-like domain-containing protein [Tanacetum coccineum]
MLQLANILHTHGFKITIIHAEYNSPNYSNYPHFTFKSIKDNFSEIADELDTNLDATYFLNYLNRSCVDSFKECLSGLFDKEAVACLITDAGFYFMQTVADELNLPRMGTQGTKQSCSCRSFSYAIRASFYHSKTDSSLFICHKRPDTTYLLLYADDIILTASSTTLMQRIFSSLHAEFAMTDLGPLNYFLGISATRTTTGIFLTPVDTEKKLGPEGSSITDPTLYRSLAGALEYLTFTRPDLSYADMLSRSSIEAEYRGVANVVAETSWIRNLLCELHTPLFTATLVYCDNVSAVYMSTNPVQHQRTKHIEIVIHFVRDKVATGHVRVLHVPS